MRMFMEAFEDSGATADEIRSVAEFVKNRSSMGRESGIKSIMIGDKTIVEAVV